MAGAGRTLVSPDDETILIDFPSCDCFLLVIFLVKKKEREGGRGLRALEGLCGLERMRVSVTCACTRMYYTAIFLSLSFCDE